MARTPGNMSSRGKRKLNVDVESLREAREGA